MTYYDTLQQNLAHNSQFGPQQWGWGAFGSQPQAAWPNMQTTGGLGFGQAAFGQPSYGQQGYGNQSSVGAIGYGTGWGGQPQGWGQQWGGHQQRQLSQQDVNEV